jgi:2-methylisocitrate lyase-like PEP mutase family enzyme
MVFADGLLSKEELERVGKETGAPSVFHPTAISPRLSAEECHRAGAGMIIYPFASVHASAIASWEFLASLKAEGTKAQVDFENKYRGHPLSDLRKLFELGGLNELQKLEAEFLPREDTEARYEQSIGI